MSDRSKTQQQQIDSLAGQVVALGAAVQALLSLSPQRDQAAAKIHQTIEQALARALASGLSDEFQRGIEAARDLYLLKKADDPGQPRRT